MLMSSLGFLLWSEYHLHLNIITFNHENPEGTVIRNLDDYELDENHTQIIQQIFTCLHGGSIMPTINVLCIHSTLEPFRNAAILDW
ncbi:hypothetical protein BLOT_009215 [Blomia tropicalis]|nr:hypothetical protein BLOT_009215 [Blomia tropicalis]